MTPTIKLLIKCLIALALIATTSAHANAAAVVAADVVPVAQAAPCNKASAPDHGREQCSRVTVQAPASNRPRTPNFPDAEKHSPGHDLRTLRAHRSTIETAPVFEIARASRRSSFWQVFAYAVRLRR